VGVRGADKHLARLKALSGPAMQREAGKLVYTLADKHATEAALSITSGAVSGKNHVPSKPGEPPNANLGILDRSIHVERTGPLTAQSVADAPYAVALEVGTSKMAARPYMRPAAKKVRKEVDALAKKAVDRILKGGAV
jgi:HK97 gp10 family phage protein